MESRQDRQSCEDGHTGAYRDDSGGEVCLAVDDAGEDRTPAGIVVVAVASQVRKTSGASQHQRGGGGDRLEPEDQLLHGSHE